MLLKATTTFHGERYTIAAGTVVDETDPVVAGREPFFEPVDDETAATLPTPGPSAVTDQRKRARHRRPK